MSGFEVSQNCRTHGTMPFMSRLNSETHSAGFTVLTTMLLPFAKSARPCVMKTLINFETL